MTSNQTQNLIGAGLFLLTLVSGPAWAGSGNVTLIRTPDGGIQPQAAVDNKGVVHLIYFQGSPEAGDIFYVRKNAGEDRFSQPLQVNHHPGSAIAIGAVRGAHIAVGKNSRVHVAWTGSKQAEPRGPSGATPMIYTRLNDQRTAFEPERNILQFAVGVDGGGSVAADASGHVYVAWHAGADAKGEANRRVWVARSSDEGKTFSREAPAYAEPTGACGCCGMRAFASGRGKGGSSVYMLYRSATDQVNRDMYLLASHDAGKKFRGERIHPWKIGACPMSTASIAEGDGAVLAAWETEGQVYYAAMDAATSKLSNPVSAPGPGGRRKHPVVARNTRGDTILVWTEGTGWKQGGSLAWQVFDRAGQPVGEKGEAPGVPVWSLAAVFVRPDGGFAIVY